MSEGMRVAQSSSSELSEALRNLADSNTAVVAGQYLILRPDRLAVDDLIDVVMDSRLAALAMERRRAFNEGPTLEEMQKRHGL